MKYYLYIIVLSMLLFSCSENNEEENSVEVIDYAAMPNQTAIDATIQFIDSSTVISKLKAHRIRIYNTKAYTMLDSGVYVEFFSRKNGKLLSTLNADSVRVDDKTKDMLAQGNVIVISDSSKTKLETSELEWNNKERKVFTTKYVVITSPTRIMRGYGLESDISLDNYVIHKVSGEEIINN